MAVVLIRMTTLNHQDPTPGREVGDHWNIAIRMALEQANRAYNPHGFFVRQSERVDLNVDASRSLLTCDARRASGGDARAFRAMQHAVHSVGVDSYERLQERHIDAPHFLSQEFFVAVADAVATRSSEGRASVEALQILGLNRGRGEVGCYWVPGITSPLAAGHTLCRPFYPNVTPVREGIFIRQGAPVETLAHELGHLLMRSGHCAAPQSHPSGCECAPADNLMHADGDARHGIGLTAEQCRRLREQADASGYLRP